MGKEKKKYRSGQATSFITRAAAIRKLQLNLVDFRRLCILKGIYPVQPKDMKKAGRGNKQPKTYFRMKDIQFLSHEPIIWKFRAYKTYKKKLRRAIDKRERGRIFQLVRDAPKYKLDHIVKERYPTFADALRDLDDPLTLCNTFSILRRKSGIKFELVPLCKRLVLEFMNYVIASRSLRKVFLTIKGIYYQAEIQGQTVTWLAPYLLGYQIPQDVDLKIISTFSEFYITLLGFVNFQLYRSLNLHYPPKLFSASSESSSSDAAYCLDEEGLSERVACLTYDLAKANTGLNADAADEEENRTKEDEELMAGEDVNSEEYKKAKEEENKLKKFKSLFQNCKFFLSRETPREALTFVIRSFGGKVSWDKVSFIGATYDETDESITHQVVDRPAQKKQFLSRYYVQPQWVFDCVNSRMLIPVEDYFPGAELPPHLSPFVQEKDGDYMPPERRVMLARLEGKQVPSHGALPASGNQGDEEDIEEFIDDMEETTFQEDAVHEDDLEGEAKLQEMEEKWLRGMGEGEDESSDEDQEKTPEKTKKKRKRKKKSLSVTPGEVVKTDKDEEARHQASQELKLQEMMIPKKNRYVYKKIKQKEEGRAKKGRRFAAKRQKYEEQQAKLKSKQIMK